LIGRLAVIPPPVGVGCLDGLAKRSASILSRKGKGGKEGERNESQFHFSLLVDCFLGATKFKRSVCDDPTRELIDLIPGT
jgi:hypothetical protein